METLQAISDYYFINICVIAWVSAQVLKTVISYAITKKFSAERLVGAGGMPSSHSALVCALAIGMARKVGLASPEFALALAFAAIVMYDATGVRRAAGEQAKVLNKLVFGLQDMVEKDRPEEEPELELDEEQDEEENAFDFGGKALKEYLGHTPLEVLGGALLGILVAMVVPLPL